MSRALSFGVSLVLLAGTAITAQGQVRTRPSADDSTVVTLALAVGGARFEEAKRGRCVHAPQASIYGTMAAMSSVGYAPEPDRSVSFTVWRPMSGDTTAQLNFSAFTKGKSQRIDTVRGSGIVGKGSVRITKRGAGGRFDIEGTTGDGTAVRGYIECAKFAAPAPVGGN